MGAMAGRDTLVEYAIAPETAAYGSLMWKVLGMMRSKALSDKWDTIDTTADKSPDFTKTSLVSFKAVSFTGDGVTYTDDMYNQDEFSSAVCSIPAIKANAAKVWLRISNENKMRAGPFIVTEWSEEMPYDGACTWSISAESNGNVSNTQLDENGNVRFSSRFSSRFA
jgi:predicted secreted protein